MMTPRKKQGARAWGTGLRQKRKIPDEAGIWNSCGRGFGDNPDLRRCAELLAGKYAHA